jgi:hypothetical protein
MSKNGQSKALDRKLKVAASKKKQPTRVPAKLKSTSWYEEAARSIGISSGKEPKERNSVIHREDHFG